MALLPRGEFTMGSGANYAFPDEKPAHAVKVAPSYIDIRPVINAEFAKFTEATGYETVAERAVDWEELRRQVPPGTPKPPEEMLAPGSLVFRAAEAPVDLRDVSQWWVWTPGASWRHPEGPGSTIEGREDHPIVQVAFENAQAYAQWARKRLPTEADWEFAARGGLEGARFAWGNEENPDGRFMVHRWTGEFPYHNGRKDGFAGTSPALSRRTAIDSATWAATRGIGAAIFTAPTRSRRVTKDGSFLCHPSYCESYRPSARRGTPPDTCSSHVGFRCATDVPDNVGSHLMRVWTAGRSQGRKYPSTTHPTMLQKTTVAPSETDQTKARRTRESGYSSPARLIASP